MLACTFERARSHLTFAGASATCACPKQYCEHSTLRTAQHRGAAGDALLPLHGLEAPPSQLVGGEGGRHCCPTEQLQRVAAGQCGRNTVRAASHCAPD